MVVEVSDWWSKDYCFNCQFNLLFYPWPGFFTSIATLWLDNSFSDNPTWMISLGQLLPRQFLPRQFPPDNFHPGQFPLRQYLHMTITSNNIPITSITSDNIPHHKTGNCPGWECPVGKLCRWELSGWKLTRGVVQGNCLEGVFHLATLYSVTFGSMWGNCSSFGCG